MVLAVDLVIAVELGQLGFDFRHLGALAAQGGRARTVFIDARLQRRHPRLGFGQGHTQLLQHRAVAGARVGARLRILGILGLARQQLFQQATVGDDVRVLLGVLGAQAVECLVDAGDTFFERRVDHDRQWTLAGSGAGVARDLAPDRVARLLGFGQFQARLVQRFASGHHARVVVGALAGQHAHVLDLEFLERILGVGQAFFVTADLVVDELDRFFGILALATEAAFHEDGQESLHHVAALLGAGRGIADGVDVVALGTGHPDRRHQFIDDLVEFLGVSGADVEVDLAHHAFHVRTAEQGAAHEQYLLFHGGHGGHSRH